ncbi:hypothetical protein [Streptomyces tricolor]
MNGSTRTPGGAGACGGAVACGGGDLTVDENLREGFTDGAAAAEKKVCGD